MSNTYNGVGYIGEPDYVGNTLQGVEPTQDYLTFKGTTNDAGLLNLFVAESFRVRGGFNFLFTDPQTDVANFGKDVGFPSTLEDTIVNFRVYLYAQYRSADIPTILPTMSLNEKMAAARTWLQTNAPNELDPHWSAPATADLPMLVPIWDTLVSDFKTSIGFTDSTQVYIDSNLVTFGTLTPQQQSSYLGDLLSKTYKDYRSSPFPEVAPDVGVPAGSGLVVQWSKGYNDYLRSVVLINGEVLTGESRLSYEKLYKAFFPLGDLSTQFNTFFASFIQKIYGDPSNPVANSAGFTPSQLFDKWTTEVLDHYYANLKGSTPLGHSSSDAGSAKTFVLNRIFALLVSMIETLQNVAASQSDRMLVYGKWQKAYTDLQNDIRFATENDGRFNKAALGGSNNTNRTSFNEQNTSYTEIIKARKQTVGDEAKNMQTQQSQSTDAVNQQASMATSILQELSSILSSLYR